jgi:hypothetical protein
MLISSGLWNYHLSMSWSFQGSEELLSQDLLNGNWSIVKTTSCTSIFL